MPTIDDLAEVHEAYLLDVIETTDAAGVVVALGDRSGRVIELSAGLADVAGNVPITPAHTFAAGSFSKPLIATAVMHLVERGLLDLYAPISSYLGFDANNPAGPRAVTLADVLSHQSGLATDGWDSSRDRNADPRAYLRRQLGDARTHEYGGRPLWIGPVGKQMAYSSGGFEVAAEAVSQVAGMSFEEYVQRHIFDPLAMRSSAWPGSKRWDQVYAAGATGYSRYGPVQIPTIRLESGLERATGLWTTAGDYTRLMVALMTGGSAYGVPLLPETSRRAMQAPRTEYKFLNHSIGIHLGLGLMMRHPGERGYCFGHGGAYPLGYWALSFAWPEFGIVITVAIPGWRGWQFFNPFSAIAPGIVADYTAEILERGVKPSPLKRPPGAESYAIGLVEAEKHGGAFGIPGGLSDADAAWKLEGTRSLRDTGEPFSASQFAAGVRAMRPHAADPKRVRDFLWSEECYIRPGDMRLFLMKWGAGHAHDPFPTAVLSDLSEHDPRYGHLWSIGQ